MTNALAACRDDDLACFRRGFLERGQQIDSLAREIKNKDDLLKAKNEQITLQAGVIDSQKQAIDLTRSALPAAQRAWYEDGRLWFGVGTGVGVALTILTVFVVGQALR